MPAADDNPYRFHPLAYWAMAAFWLVAPFLMAERWWLRLALITIFWMLAYTAMRLGIASREWRLIHRKNSN